MNFAFAPPPPASLAVVDSELRFPVHRVYCVAKNYAAHAREMGEDPDRVPPAFFLKPADAVVAAAGAIDYPPGTEDLHHEVELVVAIGGGTRVAVGEALNLIYGYAVGLDMTRRDLQQEARRVGGPWDTGKSFEQCAPVSAISPRHLAGDPDRGRIWLEVNDRVRQDGDIADMIWSVAEILARLSRLFVLQPGDLVFTGTPEGVGPVLPGDRLRGGIDGVGGFSLQISG
jgi:fumarylpyruvate hydrolase